MSGSGNQADGGLRRSSRVSRPPLEIWLRQIEANLRRVKYMLDADSEAGSKSVSVTLGPGSYMPQANDANPDLPSGIALARETYPACNFKAGHMLNCDLGGNGKLAGNMTILTASANTSMTSFDNNLKYAAQYLRNLYTLLYDAGEHGNPDYCVKAVISVGERWGTTAPDKHIARAVTVAAKVEGGFQLDPQLSDGKRQDIATVQKAIEGMVAGACGSVENIKPTVSAVSAASPMSTRKRKR